jgi:hypothetical protein
MFVKIGQTNLGDKCFFEKKKTLPLMFIFYDVINENKLSTQKQLRK